MNNTAVITATPISCITDALKVVCGRSDLSTGAVNTTNLVNTPYTLFSHTANKIVMSKPCLNAALSGKHLFLKFDITGNASSNTLFISVGISNSASTEPAIYKQFEIADAALNVNLGISYIQAALHGFHAFEAPGSASGSFAVFENNCPPINGIVPLATYFGIVEGIHSNSVFYDTVNGRFLDIIPTMFTSYFCGTFKPVYSGYNDVVEGVVATLQTASAGVKDNGTLKQPLVSLYAAIDDGIFDLSSSVKLYAFANVQSNINTAAINIGGYMYCFQHTNVSLNQGLCFAYAAA